MAMTNTDLRDLAPIMPKVNYTAGHISAGIPIPKIRRVELFSPEEWEAFTEEWAYSLTPQYHKIRRVAGSRDKGVDVIGFITDDTYEGGWDNYQCKHYNHPLRPNDIWVEIGKIIFYSFSEEYTVPRKYYFVCPRDVSTALAHMLSNPEKLKEVAKNNWAQHCEKGISSAFSVPLTGDLLTYFDQFDFSIFSSRSPAELIQGHARTPFHAVRFGGGLPARPTSQEPPEEITASESRYIQQIFEAYVDQTGETIADASSLRDKPDLQEDFLRQRERFFHAESLRNFARDTVPEGTFEELQKDVFHGVVDVCQSDHADGLVRMRATLDKSTTLSISSSPLSSVLRIPDRQGICHQLANADQLIWVPSNEDK
jgi:hypothetical protein